MHLQQISDALAPLSPLSRLSLSSPHRILIVGCAYGGIAALVNLIDLEKGKPRESWIPLPDFKGQKPKNGIEITVIDERDGYFHSVGAPLAHVAPKHTASMWKRFTHLNEFRRSNLHFKHGSVKKIDPEAKVAEWQDRSGNLQHQYYDYVIVGTGLKRHWPAVPKSGSYEEFRRDGQELIDKITGKSQKQKGRKVVIIGAGAVGIEFAGEIKNYYPDISVTLVHSRSQVLSSEPLPSDVKDRVKTILEEEGVDVVLENRANTEQKSDGTFDVTLANGTVLSADLVLDTTKKGSPTTEFLPAETLDEEKEIKINAELTFKSDVPNADSHFGIGDVVAWGGIKRAGGAMGMGHLAAFNVFASILNKEEGSTKFELGKLPEYNNVIGIAIGKQCLTYAASEGVKYGVEVMKTYFGDDLGWASNLKYLGLTDVVEVEKAPAKVEMGEVGVQPVAAAA